MPNWCSNVLGVAGPHDDVHAMIAAVNGEKWNGQGAGGDSVFSLQSILPVPNEVIENGSWYDWCVDNWGTKWDVDSFFDDLIEFDEDESTSWHISFESAWPPPLQAMTTLAQQWPSLTFVMTYDEPGNNFGGEICWSNGKEEYHNEHASSWSEEEEDFLFDQEISYLNASLEKKCKRL